MRWLVRDGTGSGPGPEVFALVRPGADPLRLRDIIGSVRLVEADLLDRAALTAQLETIQPQLCFHFAWYAVPGLYLRSSENLRSLQASIGLASRLAALGCRHFVGVGTCFEYAMRDEPLAESSPTAPASIYAAAKLAFQLLLQQIAEAQGMRWLWARVFYQYGPFEDPRRLVPTVTRALLAGEPARLTSGEQARDFLHVEDVAAAIGTAADSELDGVVNIGSGVPVRVADLARRIGALLGRPELVHLGARPDDRAEPRFICADPARLLSTGWRPTYNLDAGLADTVKWWKGQQAPTAPTRSKQGR